MSKVNLNTIFCDKNGKAEEYSFKFAKTPKKKPSNEEILNTDNKTDYDPFLEERGFGDLIPKADSEFKTNFAKTIMSMESKVGTIDLPSIIGEKKTGMIRSKETDTNINLLLEYIKLQNSIIKKTDLPTVITNIPIHKLTFNKIIEGKFKHIHVPFDTEADKFGHTVINTAVGIETKRIVVAYFSDEFKLEHCKTEHGWDFYRIGTQNLWEANLLADYESLIAANLLSTLEQGSVEVTSIYKKLFPLNIIVDTEVLYEKLDNTSKSMWICHNNRYDINQLNAIYKHKRGKRRGWNIVKTTPVEFVTIRHNQEDLYKIRLGNSLIGFRFNAACNTRFSFNGLPQITLAPIQANSYSLVNGEDTLNLAFAGQFENKKLESLSSGLEYQKQELDEAKVFDLKDLKLEGNTITDKLKYNIMDCFATASVYRMLSYHFNLIELGNILEIDLSITKDWKRPFAAQILSPASIAKFVFDTFFQTNTGLSRAEIESNFELVRKYLTNFSLTYFGGRTETYLFKLIKNTVDEVIKYPDFESQYPNAARLIQAEKILLLTAKGELLNYLDYDTKAIEKDFWKTLELTIKSKENNTPLPDYFAENILGNVTFTFERLDLHIRTEKKLKSAIGKKKAFDMILQGKKKNKVTCTLLDLLTTCEKAYFYDKTFIHTLKKRITFIAAERLLLGKVAPFGEELFTKILKFRRIYKAALKITESLIDIEKEGKEWEKEEKTEQLNQTIQKHIENLTNDGLKEEYVLTVILQALQLLLENYLQTNKQISFPATIVNFLKESSSILKFSGKDFTKKFLEILTSSLKIPLNSLESLAVRYKATEQNLKYVMNSGYGVTAEGLSKGYIGKFQVPAVATLITACARYLSNSAEILYVINGGKPIYTDTDSLPALASEETHQTVFNYFKETIPLNEERKYGKITSFHVLGKKKYGFINDKGEIHVKIHGTAGYKATEEAYQTMYEYLLTTDMKPEEIAAEVVKKHPIHQSITYRKDDDGRIKRLKEIINKGKLLREYEVDNEGSSLTIFVFKEKEDYLFINTKDVNKGMFGDYLNVDRYYNSAIKIVIFNPCKFNNILDQIMKKEKETEIFKKIKHSKKGKQRITNIYNILLAVSECDLSQKIDYNHLFKKIKSKYRDVYINSLQTTINSIKNTNITTKQFIQQYTNNTDILLPKQLKFGNKLLEEHGKHESIETKEEDTTIHNMINEKLKIKEKFIKLMQFDKERFRRDRITRKNTSYDTLVPSVYRKQVKHEEIKEYINTDTFTCDGFDMIYSAKLPAMDFSASGKSDETSYYSQTIENIARTASKIWVETHTEYANKKAERIRKIYEDPITKLPCPKSNINILVPFKICLKIPKGTKKIPENEMILIFDDEERSKMIDKKILEKVDNNYIVLAQYKFNKALRQVYKSEWIEIEWLDRIWSLSIEKRQSLNYNAMLSIKVTVGKDRVFLASLRLNPSSKHLNNLDLFRTNIRQLDEGAGIGRRILQELFNKNIEEIQYYSRKRATHLEDLQAASKPYEAYKLTYIAMAHKIMKQKMKHLSYKLGTVAYAINMKTKTPVTELIPYLHKLLREQTQAWYDKAENESERIKRMEAKNVSHNRFSLGLNINEYDNKTTTSIYAKDFYQIFGKLKRMLHANELKELPVKHLTKLRHIKESEDTNHQLRVEITIRGWKQIHTKAFYRYLENMKDLIEDVDDGFNRKGRSGKSEAEEVREIITKAEIKYKEIKIELETELSILAVGDSKSKEIGEDQERYEKYDMIRDKSSFI